MRRRAFLVLPVLAAHLVAAQTAPVVPATLTLDEAISLARQNSPSFLQAENARRTASAAVKSAYGALLPSLSASYGSSFLQGGEQFFDGTALVASSNSVSSSYYVGLNYSIGASSLIAPSYSRVNRAATDADIGNADQQLRSQVTQAYVTELEDQARAALQDTLRTTALAQLDLVEAKLKAGSGISQDVSTAQVAVGQADVAVLTARNTVRVDLLQLYQLMGLAPPAGDVRLTTTFTLSEPDFTVDSLIALATRVNPALAAQRIRETASGLNIRMARANQLPSLSVSTGLAGNAFHYTDSSTSFFPSSFTRSPISVSAGISVPLFDQFTTQVRVEQAEIDHQNQGYALRGGELQLTTSITQAYLTAITAYRTIQLQEQVAAQAADALSAAEQRYRLGAAPFIDVTTAQGTYAQSEINRVNSIYDYQKAFTALEAAVGQPLR
jgi:outer membrane protein